MAEQSGRSALERACAGDAEAFGELFLAHRADVERLSRRILGDAASAEDAAAETFLRAGQRLESYDPRRPFRPWLLAIAAHHCIDVLRRRSGEARIFQDRGADVAELPAGGPSPLRQLLRAEERAALLAAIDALPDRYRVPLVLRHFAALDYAAIGAVLDVSRNQVGTLLLRARRRLRRSLEGAEP